MMTSLIRGVVMVIAVLAVAGLALLVSTHVSSRVSSNTQRDPRPKTEGEEADAWWFNQRAYPSGSIPAGATEKAWRESMRAVAPQFASPDAVETVDHWTSIGPDTIAGGQLFGSSTNPHVTGRIVDIAVDPNPVLAATHWFVASEGGGIWETTNGGGSWTPKTDAQATLGMTTISVAPSNPQILFAGTRNISTGVGVLKSTDGGATWSIVNQNFLHPVTVKVSPSSPLVVLAIGTQFSQPGVFKSINGGTTFFLKLPGPGGGMATNPANFNQQYAAVRGGSGGVFRSMDGGDTWTQMAGPWDPGITGGGSAVKIAIAPSDPNVAYIVVPGVGMWSTQKAWKPTPPWTALPAISNGFTDVEAAVVDPANSAIFYAGGGGENFYRYNGGWLPLSGTHHDQRVLAANSNTLLLGNDGGFWTSTNQGTTWENKNSNLATVQFYAGSLHPTNATAALGGSLDNGSELWTGSSAWDFIYFGDGGYSAFASAASDPDHNFLVSHIFMNVYKGAVVGSPPYNQYYQYIYLVTTQPMRDGAAFIAPVRRSPNGDIVLAGSDNLWRTDNFFTAPNPAWSANGPEMGSSISAITFAPSDTSSQTYAFGVANGALRLTVNGGQAWNDLDSLAAVPDRSVTAIAFHPATPATIFVALSGFNSPGSTGHIFRTFNGLATHPQWIDVSPPVDLPMDSLAIDPDPLSPNTIYAGSDQGVWKSTDLGGSWTFMGPASGMPNAPVSDLLFSPVDGRLVAFTFGRGAFKLNVGSLQVTITPPAAVTAGAKWKVDTGVFQNSGTTVVGLSPGNHTVSFSPISGYSTPANQSVSVTADQTTQATGVYLINK